MNKDVSVPQTQLNTHIYIYHVLLAHAVNAAFFCDWTLILPVVTV